MPRLDGKDYNTASRELRELGLKPVVPPEYEYHETIEEGYIISYTPQEGLELPPGTEVYMVVSKGPADKPFPMPDLVGKNESMARSIIENSNLTPGNMREEFDDTVEAGKVVSQYPLADTDVTEGTTVNLVISKGPDPATQTTEPPVTDDPEPPTDPTPVTKSIHIKLDGYEGTVNVRVLMDGNQVFSQDVDTSMETGVDVPVQGTTGMGVKELAVYLNGVASGTYKVNFDE